MELDDEEWSIEPIGLFLLPQSHHLCSGAVLGQLLLGGSTGEVVSVPQAEVSGYGNRLLSSDGVS